MFLLEWTWIAFTQFFIQPVWFDSLGINVNLAHVRLSWWASLSVSRLHQWVLKTPLHSIHSSLWTWLPWTTAFILYFTIQSPVNWLHTFGLNQHCTYVSPLHSTWSLWNNACVSCLTLQSLAIFHNDILVLTLFYIFGLCLLTLPLISSLTIPDCQLWFCLMFCICLIDCLNTLSFIFTSICHLHSSQSASICEGKKKREKLLFYGI